MEEEAEVSLNLEGWGLGGAALFEIEGWGLGETAPVELKELEEFEEVEEAEEVEEVEVEEVVEVDVGTAKVVPSLAGVPGGNKGSAPGNGTT